jgi:hypothetical protein
MSFTITAIPSDGVTKLFPVSFPNGTYNRESVKVYVQDDVDSIGTQLERPFTWVSGGINGQDGIIKLVEAAPAGKIVTIRRIMNKDRPDVDFLDGSILTGNNLNKAIEQLLNIQQEMLDDNVSLTGNVRETENGTVLTVADGVLPTDAVNLAQVLSLIQTAESGLNVAATEYQTGFVDQAVLVPLSTVTYVPGTNNLIVYRNGLAQSPNGIDYTETSPTSITFVEPLAPDERVIVKSVDSITNSVSSTSIISHTTAGVSVTLASYLEDLAAIIAATDTAAIAHTNLDGTYTLKDYLDAEKSVVVDLDTNAYVATQAGDNAVDFTGMYAFFAEGTTNPGWLPAEGGEYSRVTYARLFAKIGTLYGAGDGSTTFNVPDGRGRFLRALDQGKGIDTGRTIESPQLDAVQNIVGSFRSFDRGNPVNTGAFSDIAPAWSASVASGSSDSWGATTEFDASKVVRTDDETRPTNIAGRLYIKY